VSVNGSSFSATSRVFLHTTLVALVVGYAVLTVAIVLLNPPWEAPDEADHAQNVETLVDGRWYRMERGAGLEPHQPPLYYLVLAGLQKLSGEPARAVRPVPVGPSLVCLEPDGEMVLIQTETPLRCARYRHDRAQEPADERLARWLRLPSVAFGVAVLLLTAAVARRMSNDPWTPFAAAAFVAGVPGFAFTSAIVSNDGSVTLLAAITLLVTVVFAERAPTTKRSWPFAVALGVLLGMLLLTKLYGLAVVIGIAVGFWLATRNAAERTTRLLQLSVIGAGAALVTAGWWLFQNQRWYGDPLALARTREYLEPIRGLGLPRPYGAARILLVDARERLVDTFLYRSTLGRWLWLPLVGSVACLGLPGTRRDRAHLAMLGSFVLAGLVALAVVALQTRTFRSSTAYIGLPALAVLAALGVERLAVPTMVRLLVPLSMCVATIAIYQERLVALYRA
jgi:hypothetical protein